MIICLAMPKSTGKSTLALNLMYHLRPWQVIDLEKHAHGSLRNFVSLGHNPPEVKHAKDDTELSWMLALALENRDKITLIDTGGFDAPLSRAAMQDADIVLTPSTDSGADRLRLLNLHAALVEINTMRPKPLNAYVLPYGNHHAKQQFPKLQAQIEKMPYLRLCPLRVQASQEVVRAANIGSALKHGHVATQFQRVAKFLETLKTMREEYV